MPGSNTPVSRRTSAIAWTASPSAGLWIVYLVFCGGMYLCSLSFCCLLGEIGHAAMCARVAHTWPGLVFGALRPHLPYGVAITAVVLTVPVPGTRLQGPPLAQGSSLVTAAAALFLGFAALAFAFLYEDLNQAHRPGLAGWLYWHRMPGRMTCRFVESLLGFGSWATAAGLILFRVFHRPAYLMAPLIMCGVAIVAVMCHGLWLLSSVLRGYGSLDRLWMFPRLAWVLSSFIGLLLVHGVLAILYRRAAVAVATAVLLSLTLYIWALAGMAAWGCLMPFHQLMDIMARPGALDVRRLRSAGVAVTFVVLWGVIFFCRLKRASGSSSQALRP